jgi:hypothetical protein
MTTPTKEIERILFEQTIDTKELEPLIWTLECINYGDFKEVNWLNTPGPIYTTYTDNCGTGQVEASNNVGGDEDYHEIIFKQPFSRQELKETLTAAAVDPYGAYYFDGNQNWNAENVLEWWNKSEERISYILDNYKAELNLPDILDRPLYGPRQPIPENYKFWLDFYQLSMKEYLEWYISRIHKRTIHLPQLSFDWTRRNKLDEIYNTKRNDKKNSI